ncbi:hypothetical protein M409DRAFT_55147 [Zasmidium cellare ATCC 36951]|uniref:Uncharacterized protein n=1 Tax=Zasmidium cellare ATCC 36951 TaxID=1080233 RepID=A0A6A6CK26_ZASCE|nr:uncharacterized protein M409DRAFT_55147 [Zasmidium cellare ATCC 36951]KAF2166302.1 hypothetical protein M409DRAFT_55147 [Zasmidium cellare ATCC 36951]
MDFLPGTPNASNKFLSLPPELHAHIFEYLGFPPVSMDIPPEYEAWAALERTCRLAQGITEPYLYHKIYTNVRTHGRSRDTPWKTDPEKQKSCSEAFGTAQLVDLLERRPNLQKLVHYLVIDEYDPLQFRRLLRLRLESLESIICQHEGDVTPVLSSSLDDPDALVESQGKLTNFVLSIQRDTSATSLLQTLALSDAPLMRHPATTRIRLSYLDITCFENLEPDYFTHTQLSELNLEQCKYSLPVLGRFIQPSANLTKLYLHFDSPAPFTAEEELALIPMIQSVASKTLKILKFVWRDTHPKSKDWPGWDFTKFEALRYLHVSPYLLFPNKENKEIPPMHDLLARTLPPRLKLLGLEGIIPIDHPGRRLGLGLSLSQEDTDLLEGLVNFKAEGNVPSFRHLLVFYAEGLAGIPQELVSKAAKQDVSLGFLQSEDHEHLDSLDMEWLDGENVHGGEESEEDEDEDEWEDDNEDEWEDDEDDDNGEEDEEQDRDASDEDMEVQHE